MLDIIIPVYNEGKNIKKLFDEIANKVKTPFEASIIYDFDEDDTLPVVNKISKNYSFNISIKKNKYGKGALQAILTGMEESIHEAVLVVMADLSDSLEIVDSMYSKIINDNFDLVCGSRYMKGGKQYGGPLLKGLFSRIAGISLHFLTQIPTHDISNSFKMYRKTMLDTIKIESNGGFEIGMEITVKAYTKGYIIGELPSSWYDRDEGASNFHMWKWMPCYLHWYFYCITHTWFKRRGEKI